MIPPRDRQGPFPIPDRVRALPPSGSWNDYAQALIALGNEMLIYARHWEDLRNPDRAAMFHQASATYALAAAQAQQLVPLPSVHAVSGPPQ